MANEKIGNIGAISDATAMRLTVHTVLGEPAIKKISFDHAGFAVRPSSFAEVDKALASGRISIAVVRKLSSTGVYDVTLNRLEFKSPGANTLRRRALIVHECVHAWFDLSTAKNMKVKTSEAMAFLAQCIFARTNAPDPKDEDWRLYEDDNPALDAVFAQAWLMAGDVVLRGRNPSGAAFTTLEDLIAATKAYRREANHLAKWDGVP